MTASLPPLSPSLKHIPNDDDSYTTQARQTPCFTLEPELEPTSTSGMTLDKSPLHHLHGGVYYPARLYLRHLFIMIPTPCFFWLASCFERSLHSLSISQGVWHSISTLLMSLSWQANSAALGRQGSQQIHSRLVDNDTGNQFFIGSMG